MNFKFYQKSCHNKIRNISLIISVLPKDKSTTKFFIKKSINLNNKNYNSYHC